MTHFIPTPSNIARILLLTAAYFGSGWLGLQLPYAGTHITLIWLPTGIAVAALWKWNSTIWPGIYLGAFLVNLAIGSSWPLAATIAIGNTLAPLLSVSWLKHSDFHATFDHQSDVGTLVIAATLGMTISALGGVSCLYLTDILPQEKIISSALSWWMGDSVGVLLATPLLLSLNRKNLKLLLKARIELAVWLLTAGAVAWVGLIHDYQGADRSLPLAFLTMPLLTWAGLRFGNIGAALAALGFSVTAAWVTATGHGAFALPDVRISLMLLWIYMATSVLTGLMITALQAERLKMENELRLLTESLNDAQHIAHIGSWRLEMASSQLSWSDEIFRLFEIEPDRFDATYQTFLATVHPEDRAAAHDAYLESLSNRTPYQITHRLLMPDGRIKWVHERCTTTFDAKGKPIRSIGTVQDITERKQIESKLVDSESRLRAIIETEPECIKIIDTAGLLVQINQAGLTMLEADTSEQMVGKSALELIAPEYRKAFADLHQRVLNGEPMQMEYEAIGLKGGRRWLETHAVPMREADGNIAHLAITRDITERKQAEHQLRIAATVFESQEGMMVTDANNIILRVNKAFSKITGYRAEDVIGKNPRFLQSGRHSADFYIAMWENLKNNGSWEGEIWNKRKNGDIFPEYLTITAVKTPDGAVTHYVGTLIDITLKKAAAEEIERLAFYDPLTNLPNRRLLQERLQSALISSARNNKHGALLFIDLDNFKSLNDTLGHDQGDYLLQQVAERLRACVRASDTVARLGGDEFIVMLEALSGETIEAAKQAETIGFKIRTRINQPFKLTTDNFLTSPSIGATLFKGQQQSVEELLKHSDIAMYQAKMSGRNTLRFFEPEMQKVILDRVSLEDELRKALEQEQFELHYQIQITPPHHALGAEALLRWPHPKLGMVSPAKFIPLAENTSLIIPIGQWVLNTACAQLKTWQQHSLTRDLILSVNVSAKQFFQRDFVTQVQNAIERHSINPRSLKLELTETLLIENVENTIATMNTLGAMGVQFTLDDFGTGYSSLQYLKKLPLNQLKIDKTFVRDIVIDRGDQAIVRTIIAMAESLDLGVIAEGVETEKQRLFLWRNGCYNYQGYLFGRPVPADQFESQLRRLLRLTQIPLSPNSQVKTN